MDAYFALAAFVFFVLMCCVVSLAVVQGARIDHLEKMNAKLREAIRPFDRDGDGLPGGSALDPYVKRALDRSNASSVGSRKPA